MTRQDKELRLKDLCARLPYGVKVKIVDEDVLHYDYTSEEGFIVGKENVNDDCFVIQGSSDSYVLSYNDFKPYLRPMSSMTEEEKKECLKITFVEATDWLNVHHFDYRGLIPMGLALEAPVGMYEINTIIAENH